MFLHHLHCYAFYCSLSNFLFFSNNLFSFYKIATKEKPETIYPNKHLQIRLELSSKQIHLFFCQQSNVNHILNPAINHNHLILGEFFFNFFFFVGQVSLWSNGTNNICKSLIESLPTMKCKKIIYNLFLQKHFYLFLEEVISRIFFINLPSISM